MATTPEARTEATQAFRVEPGSFRDPDSTVFYTDEGVVRGLSESALADWNAVAATRFFSRVLDEGKVVGTELLEAPTNGAAAFGREFAALLRHEEIPFVSYPYEWTFGMLKDAALLQLELLAAAIEEDVILKDSSPYNVQWRGGRPVFIDVGSFERMREGEPWVGYRQFCMLFLYPLLLQAYKDVPFQPWLRGAIDGITPRQCRNVMSLRDLFRPGVFSHVHMHARLEERYGDRSGEVKRELRAAGFSRELIRANVRRLTKLVQRLEWRPPQSVWSHYDRANSYTDADVERKQAFVREVVGSRSWGLVWDIGCNTGRYSRIAAEGSRYVVAMDADRGVTELLYRSLKEEGADRILPLAVNLADPSPGLGWRGRERKPLPERGRPELTLCLALIHHLAIAANVPVREFVDWLAGLGTHLVIEFVTKDDPMVQRLLAGKREGLHSDYERDVFERFLSEAFDVERSEELATGTRTLYFARPRG